MKPHIPLLALALLAAGCGAPEDSFTIGVKYDQPGIGMQADNGAPEGFDIEVAKYVAGRLGERKIRWQEIRSADRETAIADGTVDLVVASYSITPERTEKIGFAGPYFLAGQALMVRADETRITGPETVGTHTLCSVTGSTSAQKVRDGFAKNVRLSEVSSYSECVTGLVNGSVDAVTTDDVLLAGYAAWYPGKVKILGRTMTQERYGIGLRKDDHVLHRRVTEAVQKMISDGSWQRAIDRYISPSGYTPSAAPREFLPD
ncbi:glutamate ABC transporter substrate-binding protein [Pseudonocardiaceae bacterium YIM PH 21723]|nr:glutamate ABC transporter substrate-binding protein [Pseudonocardiaceae bacterium YIM PH 21723]